MKRQKIVHPYLSSRSFSLDLDIFDPDFFKKHGIFPPQQAALCFIWCHKQKKSPDLNRIDKHIAKKIAEYIYNTKYEKIWLKTARKILFNKKK